MENYWVGSIAPPQTENTSYAVVVRKLKVNWSDLEIACESNGAEHSYYLDLETGEVLMVMHDLRQEVEQLREDAGPEASIEDVLARSGAPDWQKDAMREAWQTRPLLREAMAN